jgi:type I restriction enzyme R subunit
MARAVAAEADHGTRFDPALDPDELAFDDAVAAKDSVKLLMGEASPPASPAT